MGSVHIPSPFRIYTGDTHYEPVVYSLVSLITGWWALPPAGPIATLALVQRNLAGGDRTNVAMLIDAKLFNQTDDLNSIFAPPEKQEIKDAPLPTTGERSASGKQLGRRTKQPSSPTLGERIMEAESPTPVGAKFQERAKNRLAERQAELKQRFNKTKETIKSKHRRNIDPNKSGKSSR